MALMVLLPGCHSLHQTTPARAAGSRWALSDAQQARVRSIAETAVRREQIRALERQIEEKEEESRRLREQLEPLACITRMDTEIDAVKNELARLDRELAAAAGPEQATPLEAEKQRVLDLVAEWQRAAEEGMHLIGQLKAVEAECVKLEIQRGLLRSR